MTASPKTIIVPVDETTECELALPVAAALARRTRAEIELVTIDSPNLASFETRQYHERLAGKYLAGLSWRSQVEQSNDVADALVARAAACGEKTVICMATKARNAVGHLLFGSVGDRVIELGHEWSLMVGPHTDVSEPRLDRWLSGPVNVFLDGTTPDAHVARVGIDWAQAVGSPIVFNAIAFPNEAETQALYDVELGALLGEAKSAGLDARTRIREAFNVTAEILRLQRLDAGSIVLGTHQRSAFTRMFAGSFSVSATHWAPCPVLVVSQPSVVPATA